tara:strand:+ start:226 stop:507 length:282 start_codon:yes stop_codon:yes gene_type:complete
MKMEKAFLVTMSPLMLGRSFPRKKPRSPFSAEKAEIALNDHGGLTKTPKQIIAESKALLAKKMTPEQIAKAEGLSKELLKKIEANKKADKNNP